MTRPFARQFILSTVGISLLLKMSEDQTERSRLNKISNEKDLTGEDKVFVDELGQKALQTLNQSDIEQRRQLSAELNGLYAFYEDDLSLAQNDHHWLISTDTYLGRKSAEIVEAFLREQGIPYVQRYAPDRLSTASPDRFSAGMQHLLKWCEDTIPGYKKNGYHVIFNLTGGFKSLQGYLNIIGMFYADGLVYIFEGSSSLLRIPRLPIQVDPRPIRAYAVQFAMMAAGYIVSYDQVSALPGGLLERDQEGNVSISEWGLLVWNRLKGKLLGESLLLFPRLVYSPSFKKDFERAQEQDKVRLQETLAKVATILEETNGNTAQLKQDGGLQYDNYVNKQDEEKRPIGHFRISQGIRVSCVSKNGKLYLRRFGQEPDVNGNP
ncbi:MAG: hypothetical protein Kow0063_12920 [Anaerolineae bacterium]